MKKLIELNVAQNQKILLNVDQIATIETIEHVSNSCYITTSVIIDGNNQTYFVHCSYDDVKKLIDEAL